MSFTSAKEATTDIVPACMHHPLPEGSDTQLCSHRLCSQKWWGIPVECYNAPKGAGGVGPDSQGVGLLQVSPAGCPTRVGMLHNDAARFWEVTDCCVSCISIKVVVVRHLHVHE